jgi:6-phosphogluconolactonase
MIGAVAVVPRSRSLWLAAAGALLIALVLLYAAGASGASGGGAGVVYTQTNAPGGNEVLVFVRSADGSLTAAGSVATGGNGTGSGLGDQGSLALGQGGRLLFVANAGSDEISSFRTHGRGLELVDTVASGGDLPVSVTVHRDLLYVLNAGAPGNITGFRVGSHGGLTPIPGSTRPLSAPAVDPAQVSFDPKGEVLAVTEKATNLVDTYTLGPGGIAAGPATHPSSGMTPFGFAFDPRGRLIVSEAFGGAASALSSYDVGSNGSLAVISPSVFAPGQQAACWVVVNNNGRFAYETNTGSGTVSTYSIGNDGSLSVAAAVAGTTGGSPIDAALTRNSRYLYVLNASLNKIDAFLARSDGSLTSLPGAGVTGLPAGTNGLVAQ